MKTSQELLNEYGTYVPESKLQEIGNGCLKIITQKNEKVIFLVKNGKVSNIIWSLFEEKDIDPSFQRTTLQLEESLIYHILFKILWEIDSNKIIDYLPSIQYFLLFGGFTINIDLYFDRLQETHMRTIASPLIECPQNYYCLHMGDKLSGDGLFATQESKRQFFNGKGSSIVPTLRKLREQLELYKEFINRVIEIKETNTFEETENFKGGGIGRTQIVHSKNVLKEFTPAEIEAILNEFSAREYIHYLKDERHNAILETLISLAVDLSNKIKKFIENSIEINSQNNTELKEPYSNKIFQGYKLFTTQESLKELSDLRIIQFNKREYDEYKQFIPRFNIYRLYEFIRNHHRDKVYRLENFFSNLLQIRILIIEAKQKYGEELFPLTFKDQQFPESGGHSSEWRIVS